MLVSVANLLAYTWLMFDRRQRSAVLQSSWRVAVVALLLLVVLLAIAGHSPVAVCCLVLVPVFLFSLVELPSYDIEGESEHGYVFEDGSPSLFQRPPPTFA
jgi:hypothetical protein